MSKIYAENWPPSAEFAERCAGRGVSPRAQLEKKRLLSARSGNLPPERERAAI